MSRKLVGMAIYLRHGQTNYTNIFPDLTGDGVKTIKKSATAIKLITGEHFQLSISSSPKPRAMGSASLIANVLGYKERILEEPKLHINRGAQAVSHGTDEWFVDRKTMEPVTEIRKIFFKYFSWQINQMLSPSGTPNCFICISHTEILCHFVEQAFGTDLTGDEGLPHGAILAISVFDIGKQNIVEIEITFLGRKTVKLFNYLKKEFQQ